MVVKIHKHRWIFILLLLLIPPLLNAISMWQEYGPAALRGACLVAGAPYNPWPDLFNWIVAVPLGLLAYLTMFITTRFVSQNRLTPSKYVILFALAVLTAFVSGFGTLLTDVQWSSTLRDGVGPGVTVSHSVGRNISLAFSATALILSYGFWLSRNNAVPLLGRVNEQSGNGDGCR